MIKFIIPPISFIFLVGCSMSHDKPHFEEVSSDYIKRKFNPPKTTVFINTLIRTKDYEFYYLSVDHRGEDDVYYFLKRRDKMFALEPVKDIDNDINDEFKRLQVLNDSTLVFYRQFWNEGVFGDFWIVKNGNRRDLRVDSGSVSNTNRNNLTYQDGRLKEVGDIQVDIDSLELKKLRNKLYELRDGSLHEVSDFKSVKTGINKFKDGIYYFSYPGRYLSDTLYLTK